MPPAPAPLPMAQAMLTTTAVPPRPTGVSISLAEASSHGLFAGLTHLVNGTNSRCQHPLLSSAELCFPRIPHLLITRVAWPVWFAGSSAGATPARA
jgi:hypothetical protein